MNTSNEAQGDSGILVTAVRMMALHNESHFATAPILKTSHNLNIVVTWIFIEMLNGHMCRNNAQSTSVHFR